MAFALFFVTKQIWWQDAEVCSSKIICCAVDDDWNHTVFYYDRFHLQCVNKCQAGGLWLRFNQWEKGQHFNPFKFIIDFGQQRGNIGNTKHSEFTENWIYSFLQVLIILPSTDCCVLIIPTVSLDKKLYFTLSLSTQVWELSDFYHRSKY